MNLGDFAVRDLSRAVWQQQAHLPFAKAGRTIGGRTAIAKEYRAGAKVLSSEPLPDYPPHKPREDTNGLLLWRLRGPQDCLRLHDEVGRERVERGLVPAMKTN